MPGRGFQHWVVLAGMLLVPVSASATLTGDEITAENCSVVNQGDGNQTVLICGDLQINIGYTPEQHKAALEARTAELNAEVQRLQREKIEANTALQTALKTGETNAATIAALAASVTAKDQDLKLAEEGRVKAQTDLANAQAAYEAAIIEQQRLKIELETFRSAGLGIDDTRFDEALAALDLGDLDKADQILKEIEKLEGDTAAIERRARAHYERGKIAEQRIDYRAAKDHFIRAAQLVPENEEYLFEAQLLANSAGDYDLGLHYAQRYFELVKQRHGEDSWAFATAANALALNLDARGRYSEAEPLYRRGLEINQRVWGNEHPLTAKSYNNVGSNLNAQGRYAEAEPLYRRGLEINRRVLGEDHPDTATSYNNVGSNLQAQHRYSEADPLLRRGLEISQRVLGEDHPDTATSYNNVGSSLRAQGRYSEVEPFYRRGLEIKQRVLGDDHPSTALSYNNVGTNLDDQGRYSEAEPFYRRGLEINQRVLGEDHLSTATSYNNVGSNLNAQGRYSEAEPFFAPGS